jgi:hypothetical protein
VPWYVVRLDPDHDLDLSIYIIKEALAAHGGIGEAVVFGSQLQIPPSTQKHSKTWIHSSLLPRHSPSLSHHYRSDDLNTWYIWYMCCQVHGTCFLRSCCGLIFGAKSR